jgi:diguanylate cyclase (GGDEF)-like protein/PAS domain S-box-containing protein
MFQWFRALNQTTAYLGAVIIVAVWSGMHQSYLDASALTVIVLVGMAVGVERERQRSSALAALQQTNARRHAAEAQASAARRQLIEKQYAIDQAVIVGTTDVKGRITYANDNFCRISGYSRDELLGADHRILKSGFHSKNFFRDMYRCIATGRVWRGELCNKAKDGSLYWVDTIIVPQLGPVGKPVAYMSIRIDITARKLAEGRISDLARQDALTGIANRMALGEKLEEAAARLRADRAAFSVLMLDLDGFKYINDTLGHAAGDELLKELALRLRSSLDRNNTVARLGGDEFAIIQTAEPDQREGAIALAVAVLDIVARPFDLDGHNVTVHTSIGIALAPENGVESGELMKKADLALYRAKAEGKNNFSFFDEEMSREAAERHQLLNDLRAALTRKEFELHYQPVVDARTARPCGVEALVRWRHPVEGLISPDRFIWLAEESGLMEPLGEWILEQACTAATSWPDDVKVAVNLSAAQFRSGKLFDVILCALVESGLSPQRLELEVTESILLQDKESYGVMIRQLKNIGVSIVLDDFGTGFSSLGYLTRFPFDKIKIDRTFTQGLSERADCAAVVASVLTLARGLDIIVTAEGVETDEQFQLLRSTGVNQLQGHLFGRPAPAAELDLSALERSGRAVEAA